MQTVWLEFRREGSVQLAALGTDTTFYIDGRWSWTTTLDKIHERVQELRQRYPSKYEDLLFVGLTYAGGREGAIHSMRDPSPPEWARKRDK